MWRQQVWNARHGSRITDHERRVMGYIDEVKNYLKIDKTTLVELRSFYEGNAIQVDIEY